MKFILFISLLWLACDAAAQTPVNVTVQSPDSVIVQAHASYDRPGKIHRWLFGESYRKEWAQPVKLPLIHLSTFHGGLRATQQGGGMQSKSLRLVDKQGKEWVIRSVEKTPDSLLPPELRRTFARDWLDDVTSGQHPYSALIVPPIANAVKVAHASPVIGVLASDTALGIYNQSFTGLLVLVEEREPLGNSDNTQRMKDNLLADNENSIDGREMLRARMLDVFIGDWDRHEDQWRWADVRKGHNKVYVAVPRDRDQVFHVTQGVIPRIASREYILPTLRNFDAKIGHSKWLLWKTRFVNSYPSFQFTRAQWDAEAKDFISALTDSVLELAVKQLPPETYQLHGDKLLQILKGRRERLPIVLDHYYVYMQEIVDIQASNRNELIELMGIPDGGLNLKITRINKQGKLADVLMNKDYSRKLTKEIRVYTGNGNDSIVIADGNAKINVRLIGGEGSKSYSVAASKRKVMLYDVHNGSRYLGDSTRIRRFINDKPTQTAFHAVNLDNLWIPMINIGVNLDDGFILGAGFRHIVQKGFRKTPYSQLHEFTAAHSFSTNAYRINYRGEWISIFGKADLVTEVNARAPNNTINFFGRGNNTVFDKTGEFIKYYRTRFSTYTVDPSIRWRTGKRSWFSAGPSLYYYRFEAEDNAGRFISNVPLIGSYDSATIAVNKAHLGINLQYRLDNRSNPVLPRSGYFLDVRLKGYRGINTFSRDYAQLTPEFAIYKALSRHSRLVLAERIGGTVSLGKTAFYQSAFIGGQENLLGFRQYRFAGQHSAYSNLELRLKIADVASYILPGQFGITGFWDAGRVWEAHDNSGKWHHGTGAGIYFAPASMIAFNFVMGYSREGWLPYFTVGMRF